MDKTVVSISNLDNKCPRCGKNEASDLHTCPLQVDVLGNENFTCTCCEECQRQCADGI